MNLLFHYLNRIFDAILWPFSSLPEYVDILFLSIVSAVLFLIIFKKTSKQEKIKHHKEKIYGHIIQIVIYKDQLRVILQSILGILKHNIIYIGYMLPPLLFIIIPLWIFTTQINNRFGYQPFEDNQAFILRLEMDMSHPVYDADLLEHVQVLSSEGISIETDPIRIFSEGSISWRAKVIDSNTPQSISISMGNPKQEVTKRIVTMDIKERFGAKRSKYNLSSSLTNSAEPFIPASSLFRSVFVSYDRNEYSLIWWETDVIIFYFVLILIFGYALKPVIRVNI